MKLPDPEQFNFKDGVIGGDECILITPDNIKCKWTEETLKFRSMIIRKSDGKIISRGYDKFFNWSEQPDIDKFPDGSFDVVEKKDGCCDENTVLITEDGEKTIKDICENKYFGKVLGYDHCNLKPEMEDIVAHSVKNNNGDWYELILEDDRVLKLTGTHQVFLPELNCYRKVSELSTGDNFLIK